MHGLPAIIAGRLQALTEDRRSIAYLHIDPGLRLIGAGGQLAHYGVGALHMGEPAAGQVPFLEGLLPPDEPSVLIPCIELAGGRAADLHVEQDGHGDVWVLLLDVTAERDAARAFQQKAYEMTLLREREAVLSRKLETAHADLLEAHRELIRSRDTLRHELERRQAELAEARMLQLALAPNPFRDRIGWRMVEVEIALHPAREVGGDLVDHLRLGDDLLVLLLGDVSDKGAAAALMMARTHALFRGIAARPDAAALFRPPAAAVRLANAALTAANSGCMFVTMLVAVFDGAVGRLHYTRAGHVPPFLAGSGGRTGRLDAAGGPPLGVSAQAEYCSADLALRSGDQILMVTDGITEAMDPAGQVFGDARIAALLAGSGPAALPSLLALVRRFEAGNPPSDDVAAMLVTLVE